MPKFQNEWPVYFAENTSQIPVLHNESTTQLKFTL